MSKLSPISDSPPPPVAGSSGEEADTNLQPCFVLRKGLPRKSEPKSPRLTKARRRIELPSVSPKSVEKSGESQPSSVDYERLRLEAFDHTWSKIDSAIKDVLRNINLNVFEEVGRWVKHVFSGIEVVREHHISEVLRPYPIVTDALCRQIPTAFILTKNTEFVDDLLTFQELDAFLQSSGCHVTRLSSLDFSSKHGVDGCLKIILRQLVSDSIDVGDIGVLASWYSKPENSGSPVIFVIDDMERCDGCTLAELIKMLSEWVIKIPIIFIMGIATNIDATKKVLPSDALQHLQAFKFALGSPSDRMNAIIETVLVKCPGFIVGHKIAVFLRNYFLKHDGTVTSFIRALKIACSKHFSVEPLSFLGMSVLDENCESSWHDKCVTLPDAMSRYAFDLPSCQRETASRDSDHLLKGLSSLRRMQKDWSCVVMCLFAAAKHSRMQLLDIFCEAADPSLHSLRSSDQNLQQPSSTENLFEGKSGVARGCFIAQAIHNVREISVEKLVHLIDEWSTHTEGMNEVHDRVIQLQSMIGAGNASQTMQEPLIDINKRRRSTGVGRGIQTVNDKAAILLDSIVRDHLKPIETASFHEIVCFKNVEVLQSALIGDPRRTIQVDLLKSQRYLQCSCCSRGQNAISPSMNDTSIMYNLAQEYGDLINLHDWYQAFKFATSPPVKTKRKVHTSPASKKMKAAPPPAESEASIQARFCRAITELQLTGLLRMPSKRRPDFVQRVAFGL